jgi:hypothetical protein
MLSNASAGFVVSTEAGGKMKKPIALTLLVSLVVSLWSGCAHQPVAPSWKYSDFKEVPFDPFPGMNFQGRDGNLTAEELSGRIVWNLWTGDNAGFWDWLSNHGFGTADLLKLVTYDRGGRFEKYGVINQPGYGRPAQADQYGLYVDVPKDPKYEFDSRIDTYTYGRSSGVMGLRLFPNPNFNDAAKAKWDPVKYYNDPKYYNDKNLVRPYQVGMTCSFCHTGPDPVNPPADPAEPEYANLSDYVGQHYFKVWEVFGNGMGEDSFVWQLLRTNPAGTLDTAFVATDYLNNPGTMNGIYSIKGRVTRAVPEKITGGALDLKNLTDPQPTPRVLKEGADSVGFLGALSRVYLNIGEYWEEWITHFNPLVGIKRQSPIRVKDAQKLSPHWNWSEAHSPALAAYFIKVAQPHKLANAPGASKYMTNDAATLTRGKRVFAQKCASCHSSKQPPAGVEPTSPQGIAWFENAVQQPDFLDDNFLGSEVRYPVTLIKTNATRAVARNALRGHVWDNFSSETYKTLGGVGSIDIYDPFTKGTRPWKVPANGRGYYRPPSLVSMWASAPYLHHNALGEHIHGVSVDDRMNAFRIGIGRMLQYDFPDTPDDESVRLGEKSIWRTTAESWIQIPESYVPGFLRDKADANGNIRIGPIPKGTPVNLLSNTDLELRGLTKKWRLARLLVHSISALKDIKKEGLTGDEAAVRLMKLVPDLYVLNACPDFIEDKGHYFGTELTDADKKALIEFLKTM